MSNKIVANIRQDYNRTFVKHSDGEYFTSHELGVLVDQLQSLIREMVVTGLSQPEITENLYQQSVRPLVEAAVLHYPFEHPYLHWSEGSKNRNPKEPRFCGVYFVAHPDRPEQIKIGCSIDIYQRTKALYHELGKEYVRVLGYMETDAVYEVEEYLHLKFADHRIEGEWFDYAPVVSWLKHESGVS